MAAGVKHYFKDGREHKGATQKSQGSHSSAYALPKEVSKDFKV
jgi:hypothetical protein